MNGKLRRTPVRLIGESGRAPLALPAGERIASHDSDPACPNCERTFVRRSHRKGIWEYLCSFLLIYPYRCQLCAHRFLATPKLAARTPHREFERLHVSFPASFQSAYLDRTLTGDGTVTTLSVRGCSLTAQQPLVKGNFVRLHIRHAEQEAPITIDVAVVRSASNRQLGIEFLSLQADEAARLRRLLEHLLYGRFH
jgi:hypothetical protein